MSKTRRSDILLASVREGRPMSGSEKLRLIIDLSIPSIMAQVTSVLMFFIDASMLGRLGAEASASVGLVESSTWLLGSLTGAASTGFSVQVAHFIGANDFSSARRVFGCGLLCCLSLSLLIGCLGAAVAPWLPYWLGGGADIAPDAAIYFAVFALAMPFFQLGNLSGAMLKCSGDMRTPSVVSILMCVADVVFNYIFIFVCGLGVFGAALGTAVSIIGGSLVQGYIAVFQNAMLRLKDTPYAFRWHGDYVRNALKIGSPMALQSTLMSGAQMVSTMIVAPLGNNSIAANSFAITAESLCYMPGYGIGDAATTLVGQSVGAGRSRLCRSFARMTIGLGMAVMALMGVVMYVFAPEMMALLTPVEGIRDLGVHALRIEAFAEPMFAAAIVSYSVCVGMGDTLRPALMNLFSMWCVRLTLAAWLAKDYGLAGVWTAMAIELSFRGTIFLIRIARKNFDRTVKR